MQPLSEIQLSKNRNYAVAFTVAGIINMRRIASHLVNIDLKAN